MIALFDRLKEHLPFSLLNKKEQKSIEASAKIAYYPKDTLLIKTETSVQTLFYIIKGIVEAKKEDELIDIYHQDDTFGGIELIEKSASKYDYLILEELICYEIPQDTFLSLCTSNRTFNDYFFSTIVEHMDMIKSKNESAKMADMMVGRVDAAILHTPCIVDTKEPIMNAIAKMEQASAEAILVTNDSGYGIVTDADLRKYILYRDKDKLEIIEQIQTYPMLYIYEGELLFNVLLLMTGHSIKHLPVLNMKDEPIGMLVLNDLLSYFANQTHLISRQIENANNIQALVDASRRVEIMVKTIHLKGVKARYIAKLVSEIHKKMYAKLFNFIFPKAWHEHCTLLLLGSEGRGEQILRSDQDNALIFEDEFNPENKEEITEQFIAILDKIGYPRCDGNVMLINPKWRRSISEYKEDIDTWIEKPNAKSMMDLAIFFDTFAVAGNISFFIDLRSYLFKKISKHKTFLPYFAKSIDNFEPPLGLFSRFISTDKGHKDEIDIKKGALFGLIHGIRSLALEHGITKTNTTQRIKALNDIGYMSKDAAANLIEALEIFNTLRLHAQLEELDHGNTRDNYISLNDLNKLEKDMLKQALKTVEVFKKRLAYHFKLSMVS